jgi:hypothetical protein
MPISNNPAWDLVVVGRQTSDPKDRTVLLIQITINTFSEHEKRSGMNARVVCIGLEAHVTAGTCRVDWEESRSLVAQRLQCARTLLSCMHGDCSLTSVQYRQGFLGEC